MKPCFKAPIAFLSAIAFFSILLQAECATAHETVGASGHKISKSGIRPIPGLKGCLHHIAEYDEDGNFKSYRTVRGACH